MATPLTPFAEILRTADIWHQCLDDGFPASDDRGNQITALGETTRRLGMAVGSKEVVRRRLDTAVALELEVRDWSGAGELWAADVRRRYLRSNPEFREQLTAPSRPAGESPARPDPRPSVERPLRRSGFSYAPAGDRPFTLATLPDFQASVEDILERRRAESDRRITAREARELISVTIGIAGPFGIMHFGDPHLDDPGTDIRLLERHMALVRDTPGLYASCLGDFINNWRGKLAHLHANQSTTQQEAIKLLEWFVRDAGMPWLYLVGGNHDVWAGHGDPIIWLRGAAAYEWHQCRLGLQCPNGREVRINARHKWPGNSIYGPAHGAMRGALFDGRDHIYIGGDKHTWERREQEGQAGHIYHAIQVASYKRADDYSIEIGAKPVRHGAAILTIINPDAENEPDLISAHWGIESGARFLTSLRAEWAAKRGRLP